MAAAVYPRGRLGSEGAQVPLILNLDPSRPFNVALGLAGLSSSGVAVLHLVIAFAGAPAYRYFGAGERMARLQERGSLWPAFVTVLLTLMVAFWAAYAFSGARLIARLPALKQGLVLIGAIYALRGLALIPQAVLLVSGASPSLRPRHLLFSLVSLLIGLLYLLGVRRDSPLP